ncbi:hypothetical protein BGP77_12035 [Saccharospirillum sp. MSK14-1]|nr:hypothetical protein BGP77_12035 [Saccharospirillum sp. MSK14-1]
MSMFPIFIAPKETLPLTIKMAALGFVYFIPALLLGVMYSLLKIKKTLAGVAFVSVCGGLGASCWSVWVLRLGGGLHTFTSFEFLTGPDLMYGVLTSFIVGLCVLPSRGRLSENDQQSTEETLPL